MKMSIKKAAADLYTSIASRPALQSLHAAVLKFTLYAMGIGYSEHSDRNGERRWLNELHRRLTGLPRRAVYGQQVEVEAFVCNGGTVLP